MTESDTPDASHRDSATDSRKAPRLTVLYVLALSTVALLSLGAQLLIQSQLRVGESDSHAINVAGRQRMLSQRLAKASLRLETADESQRRAARDELTDSLREWSLNHESLLHGEGALRHDGGPSERLTQLFLEVRPHFDAIRSAARRLSEAAPTDDIDALVAQVQQNEDAFLKGMDNIVSQYVAEAEGRVARLRQLEWVLLGLTLTVLLAEGLFIFRPAARRIAETMASLERVGAGLRVAKDQAELANEAKTRFLANVSHELRTPMTAVLGMTELAKQTDDPIARERYLGIVEEAGESLLRLLNDLIDTAKVEVSELDLRLAPFQPAAVTRRVVNLMQPLATKKGLQLQAKISGEEAVGVSGDGQRLTQVLINLVGNAIKYTDSGHVRLDCLMHKTPGGGVQLRWVVTDSGVGIPEADLPRLFEPFFQASAAPSDHRGGAGLGLSICRKIVEAMGGEIDLTSSVGSGTTVHIKVVLPEATQSEAVSTIEPAQESHPLNVLVVEDTEVNQLLLKEHLESAAHRVTIASSGAAALDAYRARGADLVVTDYRLGDSSGADTAHRIKALAAADGLAPPPFVCVTADADAATRQDLEGAFDAVLMKPFRRADLLAQVALVTRTDDGAVALCPANSTDDFTHEIASILTQVLPSQMSQLQDAVASRSAGTVLLLAHRLRGQVAYFDTPDLASCLSALESAARRQDINAIDRLYDEVEPRLQTFSATLRSGSQRSTAAV